MNLRPLPGRFGTTRDALHQIAFYAIAPSRYQATGRMGLQAAPGGFGTPKFDDRVARVEGTTLVHEQPDQVASQSITTVRAAADFFGVDYAVDWYQDFHDPLEPFDPDRPLDVDDVSARALGQWFHFGTEVLEGVRARGSDDDDVTNVTLWPEHFDTAIEMGSEERGKRASYGASPGDGGHDEPYVYVSAWGEIDRSDPYWNESSFEGSSLGYSAIASSPDPVAAAVEFLARGYRALHTA